MNHGFKLEKKQFVNELNGECLLFFHEKSGARLLKVVCSDDNKVFAVAFKTPPPDDSGIPHILEHSVLNGSEHFPVKSPFDILSQGSLKTFLNAMTGSDMTIYPVASRNSKDFFNLMHVYLDAVFKPLLYRDVRILKQEGWHLELQAPDAPLRYTGVVYNEMKGAYSAPQRQLDLLIGRTLFPDNNYSKSSGGYPPAIPTLTHAQFTAFHAQYYHPSNSYIYLYGDGDLDKELAFIDETYLSTYNPIVVNSNIPLQSPFSKAKEVRGSYGLAEGAATSQQTYLAWAGVYGKNTNQEESIALEILADALVNHQFGPLRQAFQKAGIGQDVSAGVDKMQQPVLQITVDNAEIGDLNSFKQVFTHTLTQVVKKGLDRSVLEGIINRMEFSLREGQGTFTGVSGALMAMPGWMFANDPFTTLSFNQELVAIRAKIPQNYLEGLIEKVMLKNSHACVVLLEPKVGQEKEQAQKESDELAAIKAKMTPSELDKLVQDTHDLLAFQQAKDNAQALDTIPLLELSDIDRQEANIPLQKEEITGVPLLTLSEFSKGIVYLSVYLDTSAVEQAEIPYLQLFNELIGLLDTQAYSYGELENQINLHTGGISSALTTNLINRDDETLRSHLILKGKVMSEKSAKLLELMAEQLMHTTWSKDDGRLKELIQRLKAQTEQGLAYNGLNIASIRLSSYYSNRGAYRELTQGFAYYRFLCDLAENFDEKKQSIIANLQNVQEKVLNRHGMQISLACEPEQALAMKSELPRFIEIIPKTAFLPAVYQFDKSARNEGFMDSSNVQYVLKGYDYKKLGFEYSGKMEVLAQLLSTVYLQTTIRVMGGAYGGFALLSENGNLMFASYRDPNLEKTLQNYGGAATFLKDLSLDERDLRRLIIGTISKRDAPLNPSKKIAVAIDRFFSGLTMEQRQKEREEILNTSLEDLQGFARMVDEVMAKNFLCVVGNEQKIEEQKDLFKTIQKLKR